MSQEGSSQETLKNLIAKTPHEVQENVLDQFLIHRGIMTLHGLLRLYISKNGLDQGPIIDLPYHPVYPFLTIPYLNPVHYHKFPGEAYLLIWYLADTYTIGITVHKSELLKYLAKCIVTIRDSSYMKLHKWLTMFKDVEWWQENLRSNDSSEVLLTFRITTTYDHDEDGIIIQKHYDANIHKDFEDEFHARATLMAWMNGLDESEVDSRLLCPWTHDWHNTEVYPVGFREDMQQLLVRYYFGTERAFTEAKIGRYRARRKIATPRVNVYSWLSTSESESDGDDDYG